MRTIDQLTQEELLELSDREDMTIDELKEHFGSTLFVDEDFFCNRPLGRGPDSPRSAPAVRSA